MPLGLLYGLSAALAWGTTDLVSALTSRRIGSLLVAAGVTVVSAAWFVVITIVVRPDRDIDIAAYAPSILVGLLGAGGYMSFYSGLRVGPIAVVSGMVAAYGGLTVVLSVILRGETLTVLQAAGAAIATIGVILTGIAFSGGPRGTRFAGPGVVFAVIALVLFAVMAITTDIALYSADALQVLLISRLVTATTTVTIVAIVLLRSRSMAGATPADAGPRRADPRALVAIVLAGTLDVIGLTAFTVGLETAPTWMVGLASSFGPAVTIVAAVVFLGERLRPIQWLGLAGVAVGMVAIATP